MNWVDTTTTPTPYGPWPCSKCGRAVYSTHFVWPSKLVYLLDPSVIRCPHHDPDPTTSDWTERCGGCVVLPAAQVLADWIEEHRGEHQGTAMDLASATALDVLGVFLRRGRGLMNHGQDQVWLEEVYRYGIIRKDVVLIELLRPVGWASRRVLDGIDPELRRIILRDPD